VLCKNFFKSYNRQGVIKFPCHSEFP
jgi:hypothetical protein